MSDVETEETAMESSGNDAEVASVAYDAHEFEKRLIEEVKQRPFLFDHTNGGFKDLKRKDAAWITVAEAVGQSVNKCQCRWKSLRDRYVRESRKLREGNGPKRHMWEMFKYLTFLDDIPRLHRGGYIEPSSWTMKTSNGLTSGKRSAVFVVPASSSSTAPQQQQQQAVQVSVSSSGSNPSTSSSVVSMAPVSSPSPTPVLTVQLTENSTLQNTTRKTSTGTPATSNSVAPAWPGGNVLTTFVDMADGCSAFGMSVSATLRTLPLEQQELAKLRIQQVLYEVQFS